MEWIGYCHFTQECMDMVWNGMDIVTLRKNVWIWYGMEWNGFCHSKEIILVLSTSIILLLLLLLSIITVQCTVYCQCY